MVRLKEATKKMRPSGSTLPHSCRRVAVGGKESRVTWVAQRQLARHTVQEAHSAGRPTAAGMKARELLHCRAVRRHMQQLRCTLNSPSCHAAGCSTLPSACTHKASPGQPLQLAVPKASSTHLQRWRVAVHIRNRVCGHGWELGSPPPAAALPLLQVACVLLGQRGGRLKRQLCSGVREV